MAGMLRKSMLYLGLVDDEGGYEHDDAYEQDGYDREPERREPARRRDERVSAVRVAEPAARERVAERTAVTAVAFDRDEQWYDEQPRPAAGIARITTLHPRTYNDARAIGEQFRDGVPVVMDLTDMEDADAKRLVDFAAGLTFALRGRIEKVTRGVFLLSPEGVAVTLDDAQGVVEGGFYNQS